MTETAGNGLREFRVLASGGQGSTEQDSTEERETGVGILFSATASDDQTGVQRRKKLVRTEFVSW